MRHGAIYGSVVDQTSHFAELLEPADLDGAVVTSGALDTVASSARRGGHGRADLPPPRIR
jgi:hypothetical protein